jgi:hypothetical protein
MYVYTYVCMYVCMYVVCMMYVCMYVYTYVCMYVCMYVCVHAYEFKTLLKLYEGSIQVICDAGVEVSRLQEVVCINIFLELQVGRYVLACP